MNIDFNKIKEKNPKSFEKFCKKYYIEEWHICYCDLEKFFDDNGIIIEIIYLHVSKAFSSIIWQNNKIIAEMDNKIIRDDAKIQAIYKAFEIMEVMK